MVLGHGLLVGKPFLPHILFRGERAEGLALVCQRETTIGRFQGRQQGMGYLFFNFQSSTFGDPRHISIEPQKPVVDEASPEGHGPWLWGSSTNLPAYIPCTHRGEPQPVNATIAGVLLICQFHSSSVSTPFNTFQVCWFFSASTWVSSLGSFVKL